MRIFVLDKIFKLSGGSFKLLVFAIIVAVSVSSVASNNDHSYSKVATSSSVQNSAAKDNNSGVRVHRAREGVNINSDLWFPKT